MVGDYQFISGVANVNFAPHVTGVGVVTASTSPQFVNDTYSRVIQLPPDEFGGTLNITGGDIYEKNTDSYNESSIKFGQENEDFGTLGGLPSFGFSLGYASTTLPSFDASESYDLDFAENTVSEDRGSIGFSSVGGRPYTQDRPFDVGFIHQTGINR